jgi:hypothetical protein
MGALDSAGDRPEARDGTTTHEHQQRRRGAPKGAGASDASWRAAGGTASKEREALVGTRDGACAGDGCGGKCEVGQTDGRTAP